MKLLCGFLLLAVVAVMSIQAHEGLHFRRNIAQVAEQDLSSEASTAKLLEVPEKRGTKWEELRNTRARLDARRENEPKLINEDARKDFIVTLQRREQGAGEYRAAV